MRRILFGAAAAMLMAATAAYAHHSYAATYDVTREITIDGKIVQFVYRNPHSFVHVTAKGENGESERWAVEWSGTTQLGNAGVTKETLKIGDPVVILARPSRVQGEYRALMLKLKRTTDGFTWGSPGQQVD